MAGKRLEKQKRGINIRTILALLALVLLIAAIVAIVKALKDSAKKTEQKPEKTVVEVDPHEGEVLINDGAEERWIVPAEGVEASLVKEGDIKFLEDAAIYVGKDYQTKRGIDISEHQGEIDWEAVAGSGIDFAFIRVGYRGYTKGSLGEDELWKDNVEKAKASGVKTGVYFFSQAINADEAEEEANYVLELLEDTELDLPVIFDWEVVTTDDSRTANQECRDNLAETTERFCSIIEQNGYEAGVYFNRQLGYYNYDFAKLKDYMLWLADPGETPLFYYEYDVWQYSFTGKVDGISCDTDMNLMFIRQENNS